MPMGTIVTVCMLIALIFAGPYALKKGLKPLPAFIAIPVGIVVFAAGFWNVFWYALQHLTEFWGIAALISGALMMVTAAYIMRFNKLPNTLQKARPVVLLGLLICMLLYGITIYRL